MKNIIIAILSSILFYTQFCVVKDWYIVPLMVIVFWLLAFTVEGAADEVKDFAFKTRRGKRLIKKIRGFI